MNLAIVHYHLNRGGVTQVIANHLKSLNAALRSEQRLRVALFYGGRHEGWPEAIGDDLDRLELVRCAISGLDYDDGATADATALAAGLRRNLHEIGFAPAETVLHVHNHSLGKNMSLPGALERLAEDGFGLLLHIHDFPEDLRPEIYRRLANVVAAGDPRRLASVLYPQADNVHFAVLNRRDDNVLRAAGVAMERIHFLPNPVAEFGELPPRAEVRARLAEEFDVPEDRPLVLYPVRCIRRKNVGEALLWSALLGDQATIGFTLAPMNPVEQPSYVSWKKLATELKLNCVFELGAVIGFKENLAAADKLITTSVAEGFGMVYLEAWLAGRALVGRNLSEITADFAEHGLALDWFYDRLAVPVDWIGAERLQTAIAQRYNETLAAYGRAALQPAELSRAFRQMIPENTVDFATLGTEFQRQIIREVRSSSGRRRQLWQMNADAAAAFGLAGDDVADTIRHNADVVRGQYAPAACGRRLLEIYDAITQSRRAVGDPSPADGARILDFFLDLKRFRPLRAEA